MINDSNSLTGTCSYCGHSGVALVVCQRCAREGRNPILCYDCFNERRCHKDVPHTAACDFEPQASLIPVGGHVYTFTPIELYKRSDVYARAVWRNIPTAHHPNYIQHFGDEAQALEYLALNVKTQVVDHGLVVLVHPSVEPSSPVASLISDNNLTNWACCAACYGIWLEESAKLGYSDPIKTPDVYEGKPIA